MMQKILLIFNLNTLCRIISSGGSRGSVSRSTGFVRQGETTNQGSGSTTTAKHVHLHPSRRRNDHGHEHSHGHGHGHGHGSGHKRTKSRPSKHDEILKDMVYNTGFHNEGGLSPRDLDLAHKGAHGDAGAINQLKQEGTLSPELADHVIKRQVAKDYKLSQMDDPPSEEQVLDALRTTPHTSAPLVYTPMKVLKKGENPRLERDLDIQQTMKNLRSALPVASPDTDSLLGAAEDILRRAPYGDIDAPFVGKDGIPTGKSYREEAEDYVHGSPPGLMNRVDQLFLGNKRNPAEVAEEEYNSLVAQGIPPEQAAALAADIEAHASADLKKHAKMSKDMKKGIAKEAKEAALDAVQGEIQGQKVGDNLQHQSKLWQEGEEQKNYPILHPLHIDEPTLGYIKGLSDVITPKQIAQYMEEAYESSLASGLPPDIAKAQAEKAGSLVSDFNTMLRNGEPVQTALNHVKAKADRLNSVDKRRNLLQNGSAEIADLVSQKTELLQEALKQIAADPECKDKVFDDLSQAMKKVDAEHAAYLHNTENNKNIREPKKIAEQIMDKTKIDNAALLDVAYKHPIVTKDILEKGIKNVEDTAKKLSGHLDAVNSEEQKHSSMPLSALKLLNDAKKESALKKIAKKNAENEQKAYEKMLKEQHDMQTMETEEALAAENKAKKILEEGRKAAENVLNSGGTVEDATAVKEFTENAVARAFEDKEAAMRNEILKKIGPSHDSEMARRMASHIAIAHAGDNAVGKTPEEVLKKHQENQQHEIIQNALFNDNNSQKFEINSVIPDTASEVNIDKSVIKFPLKTFIDEEVSNVGEQYVKNKKQAVSEELRNKYTKKKVDSGLNVIETKDGFLNLGENSQNIAIEDGVAYFTPAAKLKMQKAGLNTDSFVAKHNQGERQYLSRGETYYEAHIKNMNMPLPTPFNKTPNTLISNGKDAIDVQEASAMVINKGKLEQIPWKEYSDMVKPKLNPYPNETEKIEEVMAMNDQMAADKRREALDSIKVNTITNPNGETQLVVVPPYGISEMFEESEGMKRLSHIDPSKNVAVSETPAEDRPEPIINPLANVPDSEVMGEFIETVFNAAFNSGKAGRFVQPTNAFTGNEDPRKGNLIRSEAIDVEQYVANDARPTSAVKNALIRNARAIAPVMDMEEQQVIDLFNKIPNSTIAAMIAYNAQPEISRPDLVDAPFFKTLQPLASDSHMHDLLNIIFNRIASVLNVPNNVTATTVEKHLVPNLKAVRTEQNVITPNGTPSTIMQATAPKVGSTVLSKNVVQGLPRVPTGPDSSYPLHDPNLVMTAEETARTKVNPNNPNSTSNRRPPTPQISPVVYNGSRPSPYDNVGGPINRTAVLPVRVPSNAGLNRGPTTPNPLNTSSLTGATNMIGNRPNAGVCIGSNAGRPLVATPNPPTAPAAPGPRLGIASSPQR